MNYTLGGGTDRYSLILIFTYTNTVAPDLIKQNDFPRPHCGWRKRWNIVYFTYDCTWPLCAFGSRTWPMKEKHLLLGWFWVTNDTSLLLPFLPSFIFTLSPVVLALTISASRFQLCASSLFLHVPSQTICAWVTSRCNDSWLSLFFFIFSSFFLSILSQVPACMTRMYLILFLWRRNLKEYFADTAYSDILNNEIILLDGQV